MTYRKSSYSVNNGACMEVSRGWLKSSHSSDGSCVESAQGDGCILVRDSKDITIPPLTFSLAAWGSFLGTLKS